MHWRSAEPAVVAVLRARGVRGHDCDDLVQEVSVRAYSAWVAGAITSSFRGWCVGTARHVSADLWRGRRDQPLGDETLAIPARETTEQVVDGRLALAGVRRALEELTPEERRMLHAASPDEAASPAEANRFYVALHRLRRRTRRLAESFAPGLVGWIGRLRSTVGQGLLEAGAAALVIGVTVVAGGAGGVTGARAPDVSHARAPLHAHAAGVSSIVVWPPLSGAAADPDDNAPGRSRTLRSPVQGTASVPAPAVDNVRARIYNSEPDEAPLLCLNAPPVADQRCVEYPVRP